jgi:hypothetical protein
MGQTTTPLKAPFIFSPPTSPHASRHLCKIVDKAVLSLRAKELDLFPKHHENCNDTDTGVDRLVTWIKEAVAQHIPLLNPAFFSVPWLSSELTELVRNARRARREYRRWPGAEAWRAHLNALSAIGSAIRKAKATHFNLAVADAARRRRGIWPLAKWSKERSHLPPTPPTIPNIVIPSGIATTPPNKAEALRSKFLPPMPNANLTDIPTASYPAEMPSPMSISEDEIASVIKKSHPFKAAGSEGIPFFWFEMS